MCGKRCAPSKDTAPVILEIGTIVQDVIPGCETIFEADISERIDLRQSVENIKLDDTNDSVITAISIHADHTVNHGIMANAVIAYA